ncbi:MULTISPECIES: FUSC family protein [unclassified Tatumella]|uniref:FUSC family protein n=1 Tax=unclassified Tatumella TaxID=2649542 RepID=UPI001BAEBA80|nr:MULTISPECIES: FUSC family protein [unclassified Tatumella]MBS0877710.1 FUSC family protein [Tatumella sp. JGM82]MBS0891415.1 FUSC family protein [Tatumella sp. JGM94]MBS0902243.1 FUSC family protein [Tatumella sp. JGM100]
MNFLTKSAFIFSLKTTLAAFLAFYLALRLNLEKPTWSLTTVYVVSQIYTASTVSKSFFRLAGTVLGGMFIFLIYPATVMSPVLFSLAVSAWVAVCLYLSLRDRTPKSYIFMLAGYSAAIMGFPDVATPSAITYTVISRIEEVAVGIIISSLVHVLIFPVSMKSLLENSVNNWYQQGKKLCGSLLRQHSSAGSPERDQILVQMANYPLSVEVLMTHCAYEANQVQRLVRLVSAQYQHLSYLVPTLTAIEKRLNLLAADNIRLPEFVHNSVCRFLAWLDDAAGEDSASVTRQLAHTRSMIEQHFLENRMSTEESLLFTGLIDRLQNVVRILTAYHGVGVRLSRLKKRPEGAEAIHRKKYIDKGMNALSAFTAFIATLLACLFWIGSGWHSGANAAMIAAVTCSFFATHDSPVGGMRIFMKGMVIAIAISIFYSLMVLPAAVTFESMIICLSPALIFMGLVIANPATNFIGLIVATQLPAYIGLTHDFAPDTLTTINAAISTMVGIIISLVVTLMIRNKRPSWTAKRALRAGIRELLQLIIDIRLQQASLLQRQQFIQRMLDRINIILPRNKADPAISMTIENNLITELWLGANLFDFYGRHFQIIQQYGIKTEPLFHEINLYLKRRLKNIHELPGGHLLRELEKVLSVMELRVKENNTLYMPFYFLFNIRLALFPRVRWKISQGQGYLSDDIE